MTWQKAIVVFVFVLITTLPLILRRHLWVRYLSVFLLLFFFVNLMQGGLRNAARNARIPSIEILKQVFPYAEAWYQGTLATQESVNSYFGCMLLWSAALAVLALAPVPKSKNFHKKTMAKMTVSMSEQGRRRMIFRDGVIPFVSALIAPLALILRRCPWLRYLSVFTILFLFGFLVLDELGDAARYTPQPSQETMERKVLYGDAWQEGRLATQKHVNGYFPYLYLWYVALAVLALVPVREEQDSPQEDDGGGNYGDTILELW